MVLQVSGAPVGAWITLASQAATIGERVALLGVSRDGQTCLEEGFLQEIAENEGRASTPNSGGLLGGPVISKSGELLGINVGISGMFNSFTDTKFLPGEAIEKEIKLFKK